MKILGIETSCDETSAAVVNVSGASKKITVLSNIVSSSMQLHAQTGGIIPEIAAREQLKYIIPVINEALKTTKNIENKNSIPDIDAIAVTVGPGLIGSLLIGVETAKTFSFAWNKPIIPINHLFGHVYANFISENSSPHDIYFPAIALIVSGGHTDLVFMKNNASLKWISGTRDDAAGEAYDKIGRLLGLTYPAGPVIEKLAKSGNPKRFRFPRPLLYDDTLDFSFSGLKTAVLREVQKLEKSLKKNIDKQTICDLAFATQDAIIDVLTIKTIKAAEKYNANSILLGGGVAANETLVNTLRERVISTIPQIKIFVPKKSLCTDNAAMIAAAAVFHNRIVSWDKIESNPELYFD